MTFDYDGKDLIGQARTRTLSFQESALVTGLDMLVETPGRILDLMARGNLNLTKLK